MHDQFYLGAQEALNAPFEPRTPCRNMPTRPCVILTHDDRQRFPIQGCLPHYCTRHNDNYPEGEIPHQWALAESSPRGAVRSQVKNFDLGDYHDGPYCVRCEMYFCRNCHPNIWHEPCLVQDLQLPMEEKDAQVHPKATDR